MSAPLPAPKRQKLVHTHPVISVLITSAGSEIRLNGTITPSHTNPPTEAEAEAMEIDTVDCPCGYLHGPGVHNHNDIAAVGFSVDVMRGPD